jgi:hypothetical protein
MEIMNNLANYMQYRFKKKINRNSEIRPGGANLSENFSHYTLYECERISDMLIKAMENQCKRNKS